MSKKPQALSDDGLEQVTGSSVREDAAAKKYPLSFLTSQGGTSYEHLDEVVPENPLIIEP